MNQGELFGGDSLMVEPASTTSRDGGSNPTSPLQPKDLRVERVSMRRADTYSIENHYLHRTAKNSKIALGVFTPQGVMKGVTIWGLPVARLKNAEWYMELRRMYLEDDLPKNSESRILSICARIIYKLFPKVEMLIAYSDLSYGHKGHIYKAAGWLKIDYIKAQEDGSWSHHPRHKRTEHGDKIKWMKRLR
jgi:hypothetical protein